MAVYVTEAQVAELLTPADAYAAVEASFGRLARGAIDNPPRVRAALPGGDFAVMPCVDHELGYAGLKSFVWLPNGAPFVVVLFSIADARLAAVVESEKLGELRTAAASLVAARRLFLGEPRTLGVFGNGRQAHSHIAAFRDAFPSLGEVRVVTRDSSEEEARAAGGSDLVVTATTSKEAVLHGAWLADHAVVCAVGANDLGSRELDDAVLQRAALVCTDSRAQAELESGDLVGVAGIAELQDVHASPGGIAVFKSNGLAAWDLAAAARVVELLDL